jgi:hypothetical protein
MPTAVVGKHVAEVVGEANYKARLPLIERAMAGERIITDTPVNQTGRGAPHR